MACELTVESVYTMNNGYPVQFTVSNRPNRSAYTNIWVCDLNAQNHAQTVGETISPENIENASLLEKVKAIKMLKGMELKITKPERYKIKGFVGYLLEIEREEKYLQTDKNGDHYN